MNYTPNIWTTGDIITAEKLNHMEGGIENQNAFEITFTTTGTRVESEQTFNEIKAAMAAGKYCFCANKNGIGTVVALADFFDSPYNPSGSVTMYYPDSGVTYNFD